MQYLAVSVHWCPAHGSALCPEMYMIWDDGTPKPGREWQEAWRCGRAEKLYRRVEEESQKDTEAAEARGEEGK